MIHSNFDHESKHDKSQAEGLQAPTWVKKTVFAGINSHLNERVSLFLSGVDLGAPWQIMWVML